MGQVSDREGSAPTLGEGEDVVRVMTVHQAKGLEFPVVVLAGLGADVHRPETSTFAVGSDGRVGMFLKGYRSTTYESHDPCWGPAAEIAAEEQRREQEEDVRLLYVAMTRAQERLVLVGARPTKDAMEGSRIGRVVAALGLAGVSRQRGGGSGARPLGCRGGGRAAGGPHGARCVARERHAAAAAGTARRRRHGRRSPPRFLQLPSVTGSPRAPELLGSCCLPAVSSPVLPGASARS